MTSRIEFEGGPMDGKYVELLSLLEHDRLWVDVKKDYIDWIVGVDAENIDPTLAAAYYERAADLAPNVHRYVWRGGE